MFDDCDLAARQRVAGLCVIQHYGWTEGGRIPQTAKMHLEKAIGVAAREGCAVTEIEIAEHHYKLVRCQGVCNRMGSRQASSA